MRVPRFIFWIFTSSLGERCALHAARCALIPSILSPLISNFINVLTYRWEKQAWTIPLPAADLEGARLHITYSQVAEHLWPTDQLHQWRWEHLAGMGSMSLNIVEHFVRTPWYAQKTFESAMTMRFPSSYHTVLTFCRFRGVTWSIAIRPVRRVRVYAS